MRVWFLEIGELKEFEDEYYLYMGKNKILVLNMINLRCLWETPNRNIKDIFGGVCKGEYRNGTDKNVWRWHWAGL